MRLLNIQVYVIELQNGKVYYQILSGQNITFTSAIITGVIKNNTVALFNGREKNYKNQQ